MTMVLTGQIMLATAQECLYYKINTIFSITILKHNISNILPHIFCYFHIQTMYNNINNTPLGVELHFPGLKIKLPAQMTIYHNKRQ